MAKNPKDIMANTFTCLEYHLIFSTKNREPFLRSDIQERVWSYLGGIARQNDLGPLLIGGMDDHVHMLLSVPPRISLSEVLKHLKGGSSAWIKQTIPGCQSFGWQDGYGAFSLSKSQEPGVKKYILKQREHHRIKSFQQEYRALLDRHGIQYNERYLWD